MKRSDILKRVEELQQEQSWLLDAIVASTDYTERELLMRRLEFSSEQEIEWRYKLV
jgi:hypothetical protein